MDFAKPRTPECQCGGISKQRAPGSFASTAWVMMMMVYRLL